MVSIPQIKFGKMVAPWQEVQSKVSCLCRIRWQENCPTGKYLPQSWWKQKRGQEGILEHMAQLTRTFWITGGDKMATLTPVHTTVVPHVTLSLCSRESSSAHHQDDSWQRVDRAFSLPRLRRRPSMQTVRGMRALRYTRGSRAANSSLVSDSPL